MRSNRNWNLPARTAAVVAVAFGLATVRSGGAVLFGDGAAAAGKVIGFVLWTLIALLALKAATRRGAAPASVDAGL
ncbi:MAG: hypothetical protein IH604_05015 [Burkholderiales bacterium]|nr:hypothetical protein [Burkholderiales bacterium]